MAGEQGQIDPEHSFDAVGRLIAFLSFVKGTRVGFGQLVGIPSGDDTGFKYIGFTKRDRLRSPPNWYHPSLTEALPTLFDGYVRRMETKEAKRIFGRALQYYKAGNFTQPEATEVALLMSAAGLETLAHHVLTTEGGWRNTLFSKADLADKLRACARLLKITADPIEKSAALAKRAKERNGDGYSVLAEFRNGLTHPGEFRYEGEELVDCWFAAQWLLEVMILALLGYRGQYQDRRKQRGGWAGAHETLPIAP